MVNYYLLLRSNVEMTSTVNIRENNSWRFQVLHSAHLRFPSLVHNSKPLPIYYEEIRSNTYDVIKRIRYKKTQKSKLIRDPTRQQ